jgi:predicted ribosome quality control (RQC) complex YloA/Tae2 family protein
MKKDLSYLDLHFLCKEFQVLVGGLLDKVFHFRDELVLRVYVRGGGKMMLIYKERRAFLSEKRNELEKLSGFGAQLRKYMSRARITKIDLVPGERIIKITLEKKDQKWFVYLELFAKGNVVFCDGDGKIMGVQQRQLWTDKKIQTGQQYVLDGREDLRQISEEGFIELLDSRKENASKKIAMSIGKPYAVELCKRVAVDPLATELRDGEKKNLYGAFKALLTEDVSAHKYTDGHVTPVKFESITKESKDLTSFSAGLSEGYLEAVIPKENKYEKRITQITGRLKMQEKRLKELQDKAAVNQRKGEQVYEHYQALSELLTIVRELKKKHTWKEVESQLKGDILEKCSTRGILTINVPD